MNFGLTLEASSGIEERAILITSLSQQMKDFFQDRDYGEGVRKILIGIICVSPEFDFFSKVRKPRYTKYRKYVREDTEFTEDRIFCFDLKLDYKRFVRQTDWENNHMLRGELIGSLSNLEKIPKNVKDFDKARFEKDFSDFLTAPDA